LPRPSAADAGAERGSEDTRPRDSACPAPAAAPVATGDPVLEGKIRQLMALRDSGGPVEGLSDFAKEYGDEAFCRRLLRKYDGDMRRSSYQYTKALRWRENNRELLTTRRRRFAGDYRVVGSDAGGHPIAYLCMKNQLITSREALDHTLVTMLQAVDNMPAGVEKAVHIWDCHGMRLSLNLDPTTVLHIAQAQEGYFAERLHEMIVVDMPRIAVFIKEAVWPFLPARTISKVKFMTSDELRTHLWRNCEEATARRICDAMVLNRDPSVTMEERRQTWMCVDPRGNLVPVIP